MSSADWNKDKILAQTESVCPVCLQRIAAVRVLAGEDVYIEKTCAEHGFFRTIVWRGFPSMQTWVRPKIPSHPAAPATQIERGCPYDCGLCPDHRQHSCSVLLEVTQRCDLNCPLCFADAGGSHAGDWSLAEIESWYRRLIEFGGPFNIQISGGEPCVRDDLAEMIRLGRSFGFTYFQINTNGLRLAHDSDFLAELKQAGLSSVFLQFDGTRDAIYEAIRGHALLAQKLAAIENCAKVGLGVVLVPTLIPGVNVEDIGPIIQLAIERMPTVRGVHFQPVSYFGRYPGAPENALRITIPEVIREIEKQSSGQIKSNTFTPPGCENALCSFHANFVLMPDGKLTALTHHSDADCNCSPIIAAEGAARARSFVAANWSAADLTVDASPAATYSLGDWDVLLERKRSHPFCISGMAFQDAWTLDLERLRDCCIHIAGRDGRLVPFCAYNLTSTSGEALYRKKNSN